MQFQKNLKTGASILKIATAWNEIIDDTRIAPDHTTRSMLIQWPVTKMYQKRYNFWYVHESSD